MHKSFFRFQIPILFSLFSVLGLIAHGQDTTTGTVTIEVGLARYVASQQVHRNNPPFEWRAIDHMVLHDIDGAVRAYAFVFAKADTAFRTPADLRRHILEESTQLREAQEKAVSALLDTQPEGVTPASVVEAEEALYDFNDLATVITGAVSDSPLILRHFRGTPEFWIEAETLDPATLTRLYGKALQVTRIIMITPMDFRLAASEGSKPALTGADLRTVEKAALPDTTQCIKMSARKAESIGAVRKERQAIETRKQQRFNTLEPAERARHEQALRDRARALADEWRQKSEGWQKAQDERGVAR